ncbi:alpha-terpineol synthase, chloroplastic-like isoform X2 [Punica granatum]|uniref:Alpha-terpineol synthase, chloroplastic-like isoform X2 n=1 Tax=Punica granatum TaxID=22663 RepID=A0A6P8D833_PUNGR|nr:alpha-terpineol synthase, chloroplastic-like isoform X2 [Punica granatum]
MSPNMGSTYTEHARMWDCSSVQEYNEKYFEEVEKMKDDVRGLIAQLMDPLAMLELIDAIQRLGLEYHFKREIKCTLDSVHEHTNANRFQYGELHAATLRFRLLRQHGYYEMPQDVFCKFTDDSGNFMSAVEDDVKGLLSLYEASFHGFEGETIMDKARVLSIAHLRRKKDDISSPVLAWKIEHALEMPIHWRPNRLEAMWFMEVYKDDPGMNPTLLKLAKLDYNLVQSIHREELSQLARWWSELGLGTSMTFSRDNLLEHYLWNVTMVFEPQYKAFREMTTKMTCVITLIDDVYDKLGSLNELELLTHLIDRWDVTRADELPLTMRTCFQALYNITNEIGCWVLKERGIEVHPYLQKAWADQCKAYLVEANWCYKGLKPSVQDYLSNAVRSVGGFIVLLCCFFITTDDLTKDKLECISRIPSVMQCSTLIGRLNNDLHLLNSAFIRCHKLKCKHACAVRIGCWR